MTHSLPAADARALGNAVRKTLKQLGLPWKVKASTASFGSLGYGDCAYADVQVDRRVTPEERHALAKILRDVRLEAYSDGGGSAIVRLVGAPYPFGGTVNYTESSTRSSTEQRFLTESMRRTGIDFFTDAGHELVDLKRWTEGMHDSVNGAHKAVTDYIHHSGLEDLTTPFPL